MDFFYDEGVILVGESVVASVFLLVNSELTIKPKGLIHSLAKACSEA